MRSLRALGLLVGLLGTAQATTTVRRSMPPRLAPAHYDKFARTRYGASGARLLSRLRAIGPEYDRLINHPGLMIRLSQFERFLGDGPGSAHKGAAPEAAFDAFSKHLGTKTVFRGWSLTDAEYQAILKKGMPTTSMRKRDLATPNPVVKNVASEILSHFTAKRRGADRVHSVSYRRDVAAGVAKMFGGEGKSPYLFEMKVPMVELLHMEPSATDYHLARSREMQRRLGKLDFEIETHSRQKARIKYSREVESFLIGAIRPEKIVSVRKLEREKLPDVRWVKRTSAATPTK